MRVYVDGVMGINFLVDFLLLLGTNRLTGFPSDKKRMLGASLLGAVYSAVCLLPGFRFLGNLIWRFVSLGLMGSIAFGWNRSTLKRCGIFLLLSMALGGLASSMGNRNLQTMLLASCMLWLLTRLSGGEVSGEQRYVSLEIRYEGRAVKLLALRDTGNMLHDPVSGEPVLVIARSAASRLTGLTVQQLQHPLETIVARPIPGLRLIPFRTVGTGSGMMLAMRFEDVLVDGQLRRAVVAFSPEDFHGGSEYQALTGGVVSC